MAIQNITYADKVDLNTTAVADINKVNASDLNEIKSVVNNNATEMVDTYSTTETKTNKIWINNKPIYRKVIYISAFPNNDELQIDINSLNLEYLVHLYGFAGSGGAGNSGFPINASRPDNLSAEIGAWLNIVNDNNVVIIRSGSDRSGFSGYLIIEYTKTS